MTSIIKTINDTDSSLNEIDNEIRDIMYELMIHADPRYISKNTNKLLWTKDRVILVDELETEEIFNAYLISNSEKNIDITYPICAIASNDIIEVFYGTGNRVAQWEFITDPDVEEFVVGAEVIIIRGVNRSLKGIIVEKKNDNIIISVNGALFTEPIRNCRLVGFSGVNTFKAKQIKTSYDCVILCDNKKEARYLIDKFILRCADGHIWHPFKSKILNNTESYIFTVFDIPNLSRYPHSNDKLKGSGYIYGLSFKINVWAILADEPLPAGIIEQITENIHVQGESRVNKISIN